MSIWSIWCHAMSSTQPGEFELWTEIMLALGSFVQYNSYLKKANAHIYASLHWKNAWDNILAGGNAWVKWRSIAFGPAFSTPYTLVPRFPVQRFPPLHFWRCPVFRSRIFSRPSIELWHFRWPWVTFESHFGVLFFLICNISQGSAATPFNCSGKLLEILLLLICVCTYS